MDPNYGPDLQQAMVYWQWQNSLPAQLVLFLSSRGEIYHNPITLDQYDATLFNKHKYCTFHV